MIAAVVCLRAAARCAAQTGGADRGQRQGGLPLQLHQVRHVAGRPLSASDRLRKFAICVTANDEFFALLKAAVQGEDDRRQAARRRSRSRVWTTPRPARSCMSAMRRRRTPRRGSRRCATGQVLTVADGALNDDTVIAFVRDDNRIRFDINRAAAEPPQPERQRQAAAPRAAGEGPVMFNRLSIRQKLTAMLMLIERRRAGARHRAFVTWDFYRFRADMQADLETQAALVLDNTDGGRDLSSIRSRRAKRSRCWRSIRTRRSPACICRPASCSPFAFVPRSDRHLPGQRRRRACSSRAHRMFVTEQLTTRPRSPAPTLLIGVDLDAHRARIRTQATAVGGDPRRRPAALVPAVERPPGDGGAADRRAGATRRARSPIGATTRFAPRTRAATKSACWCRRSIACSTRSRRRSASAPSCSIASSRPIA